MEVRKIYFRAGVVNQWAHSRKLQTFVFVEKKSHIFNSKYLEANRKCLRNNSTSAEATLWTLLKNKQLEGRKFRRQHSIGKYIVDFYCSHEKLIIELDGNIHGEYYIIEKDTIRDQYLESFGMTILRFENRLVFQHPEDVLDEIKKNFKEQYDHPGPV
jgi:very-short-patch-repair endonuclease